MLAGKVHSFCGIAPTMMSKLGVKATRPVVEGIFLSPEVDKHIKLETLMNYLEQIKSNLPEGVEDNKPMLIEVYMKEAELFLSKLLAEFEGEKDYFLPWVKFLDVASAHKMFVISKAKTREEKQAFNAGINNIVAKFLSNDPKANTIDWRIARKTLSPQKSRFLSTNTNLEKSYALKAFRAEIDIAFEHLLWQEESVFVDLTKKVLTSLLQCYDCDRQEIQDKFEEAVLSGRFDKEKFGLANSLVLGEDGGLYLLLNRLDQQQKDALISKQLWWTPLICAEKFPDFQFDVPLLVFLYLYIGIKVISFLPFGILV